MYTAKLLQTCPGVLKIDSRDYLDGGSFARVTLKHCMGGQADEFSN